MYTFWADNQWSSCNGSLASFFLYQFAENRSRNILLRTASNFFLKIWCLDRHLKIKPLHGCCSGKKDCPHCGQPKRNPTFIFWSDVNRFEFSWPCVFATVQAKDTSTKYFVIMEVQCVNFNDQMSGSRYTEKVIRPAHTNNKQKQFCASSPKII